MGSGCQGQKPAIFEVVFEKIWVGENLRAVGNSDSMATVKFQSGLWVRFECKNLNDAATELFSVNLILKLNGPGRWESKVLNKKNPRSTVKLPGRLFEESVSGLFGCLKTVHREGRSIISVRKGSLLKPLRLVNCSAMPFKKTKSARACPLFTMEKTSYEFTCSS
jgi:hypothetical protein